MDFRTIVLCCALISSVAAFVLEKEATQFNDSDNQISLSLDCKCKNGRCVKDNRGKIKCNCNRGYSLQDENTCEPCDCGKLGKCIFIPLPNPDGGTSYIKKCLCDVGSAEKDGICVDCKCGENSKCEFEDGEKVCYCIEGYAEKNGVCTKCDCGDYGECTFEGANKICTCDEDYEEINGYCVHKCDSVNCENGGTCEIEDGAPICKCPDRYTGSNCEIDKCGFISCENGGYCSIRNLKPYCTCPDRYTGENCQTDKCSLITCYNNGICDIRDGKPICKCPKGYYGKSCEIDECSNTTCFNGGECYMSSGTAICKCLPRYEGERCEIDKCSKLDCRNGGACLIENGKAICKCPDAYEGDNCEKHKCENVQCQNGGFCDVRNAKATCICQDRYTGTHCEIDQCDNLNCQNGGRCVGKYGKAVCECPPNYSGDNCEIPTCSLNYPCQNGGLCKDARCRCLPGTSGGFCEIIDECPNLCPRRSDINCTYSIKHQKAYCECLDTNMGFYPDTQECRRTCDKIGCRNGGECQEVGFSKFCNCLEGTSGELCEIINDCSNIDCGNEAICQYDPARKSAYCQCYNRDFVFNPKDQRCKRSCRGDSDCRNGGRCVKSGSLGYCDCLEGTIGDFCEVVPGCIGKDCGYNGKCEYDVSRRIAMCKCVDENFAFDPVDVRCKKPCDSTSDCKNGGTCTGDGSNKFCRCLDGTTGDLCEIVPGCENKYCGKDAKCVFDTNRRSASCLCFDQNLAFDEISQKCKRTCDSSSDCKNGGSCTGDQFNKFCRCLDGTTGDLCEIIPGCENKHCGKDAKCVFDINRRSASCLCFDQNLAFDEISQKCRKTCGSSSDCKNGGACTGDDFSKFCRCPDGTTGDLCEIVPGCDDKYCGKDAKCVFDISRKISRCLCFDQNLAFDEISQKCKKTCDSTSYCRNGGTCTGDEFNKFCRCLDGTSGDLCEVVPGCDNKFCGNDAKCVFDINRGSASCLCFDQTLAFDEMSQRCKKTCDTSSDCYNGGTCTGDKFNKFCRCINGTTGDHCEKVPGCDNKYCGKDAKCVFDINRRSASCLCHDENLAFDEMSQKCKKTCDSSSDCKNGGTCTGDEFNKFCRCLDDTTGDLCEVVPGCYNKDCGKDAKCVYDINRRTASCLCLDQNLAFDEISQKCKKTCDKSSDCKNGGACTGDEFNKFCRCLDGTDGDLCEIVPGCNNKYCGKDAKCVFDLNRRSASCLCFDQNLAFDEVSQKCKKPCDSSYDCKNGGTCTGDQFNKFCRCIDGTTGDNCEDVPGCDNKYCGKDAKCVFDINRKSASCLCFDQNLAFDEVSQKCKKTCDSSSDCKNGGTCTGDEYNKFCRCIDGTIGDNCEIVPGCDNKYCGKDAKCVYDINRRTASCLCFDQNLAFDEISQECKKTCDSSSDCKNGGTCTGDEFSKFCRCLDGTIGDNCEIVPGCDNKYCGKDAKCVYDINKKSASCLCFDQNLAFDEVSQVCKKTCDSSSDCKNGGTCTGDEFSKFCRCLDGTNGDLCEIVPECDTTDCGSHAKCVFDIERRSTTCECLDPNLAFDEISKECRRSCIDDSMCLHGGRCLPRGRNKFCHCPEGTSGDFCGTAEMCKDFCGKEECIVYKYNRKEKIVECLCKDPTYTFDVNTKTCQSCDCGGNEISCNIHNGKKTCDCPDGYADVNGKCEKYECKKKCLHGKCQVINGQESCRCFEGYYFDGDNCRKKPCTKTPCINGDCIVRNDGREECICPDGYLLRSDTCTRPCSNDSVCLHGGRCMIQGQNKFCLCPEGTSGDFCEKVDICHELCGNEICLVYKYSPKEKIVECLCKDQKHIFDRATKSCKQCDCGGNEISCNVTNGKKTCTCPRGYRDKNGKCHRGNDRHHRYVE